jgi:adenylosuccinate lyase
MKKMKALVLATTMAFFGTQVWADECATLDHDIQEMNLAISHIKEHGEISKEDAKEAARDLKQTKKDLKAVIASGEADCRRSGNGSARDRRYRRVRQGPQKK